MLASPETNRYAGSKNSQYRFTYLPAAALAAVTHEASVPALKLYALTICALRSGCVAYHAAIGSRQTTTVTAARATLRQRSERAATAIVINKYSGIITTAAR